MTTESEVLLEIHRILHELELDPQKTTALDSLSRTVLAVGLEDRFRVRLTEEDATLASFEELARVVARRAEASS